MVKDAPYPHDLIPKVKGIFEAADLLIAYNNQFDLSFLRRWGISDSGKEQYDVMLEFAQEYGEWNEYFGDYKWQKLSTAASNSKELTGARTSSGVCGLIRRNAKNLTKS